MPQLERPRAAASPAGTLVQIETWDDGQDPYELIRGLVSGSGSLEATDRMWASHLLALEKALPGTSFHPAGATMSRLRARKDDGEVELLAKAGLGTDEAFGRILGEGRRDRTERQVAGLLAGHLLEAGLDSVAFTIVGSGPNGASPHHDPSDRIARDGDTVVLDFGGRVGGYCSDMTRTVGGGAGDGGPRDPRDCGRGAGGRLPRRESGRFGPGDRSDRPRSHLESGARRSVLPQDGAWDRT